MCFRQLWLAFHDSSVQSTVPGCVQRKDYSEATQCNVEEHCQEALNPCAFWITVWFANPKILLPKVSQPHIPFHNSMWSPCKVITHYWRSHTCEMTVSSLPMAEDRWGTLCVDRIVPYTGHPHRPREERQKPRWAPASRCTSCPRKKSQLHTTLSCFPSFNRPYLLKLWAKRNPSSLTSSLSCILPQ